MPITSPRQMTEKSAWLAWPERSPGRAVALVAVVFLGAYLASLIWLPKPNGRIVLGDAVHYYVYLRSAVFDRDLEFQDEYERIYGPEVKGNYATAWIYEKTRTGHTRNLMSVGPAIVWAPLYLATTGAVAAANALGAHYPFDGYGRLFQASAGVSGIVAASVGAWLAFLWARRVYNARVAIWATLSVWLASSAVYYSAISPTYSHAASMLTASLFCWAWGTSLGRHTARRYALVGLLGGITALVRWQDAIFLAAPVLEIAWQGIADRGPIARRTVRAATHLAACAVGALVGLLPQLAVWTVVYGSPLLVPQGAGFMQWRSPALLAVLFSQHGLISWTPIVALSLVGCVLLWRTNRLVGAVTAVILAGEWYANGAVIDWWAGEAFGARRFVSCLPLFVLGLAALYDRLPHRRWVRALTIAAISLNVLLLLQYQVFLKGLRDVAPYPEGVYGLWLARFVVPFELAAKLWHIVF
ncbi:MAG: hypothetical protein ACM3NQ_01680 [Bacteroidales bacterium]